jgi:hypothetical protein
MGLAFVVKPALAESEPHAALVAHDRPAPSHNFQEPGTPVRGDCACVEDTGGEADLLLKLQGCHLLALRW